jgi:hypothetical protein
VQQPIAVVTHQYSAATDRNGTAERFSILRGQHGGMFEGAITAAAEYIDHAGIAVIAPGVLQQELGRPRETAGRARAHEAVQRLYTRGELEAERRILAK